MAIIILLFLILINGLFVMSEMSLVSVRKGKLEANADKGDESSKRALQLSNNPEVFLPAAQIGITLVTLLTGVYSAEKFSHQIEPYFAQISFLKNYAASAAQSCIVLVVTFLSILFGELIPKRIGLLRAERIAKLSAGPMAWFARIMHPIVWILNIASNLFFRIFNIRKVKDDAVTEKEIKTMITEGAESGAIDETEQEIIERVFHLGDRNITSLMTHRSDIVWFNVNDNEEKIKQKILLEPHSAYPICADSIDEIRGVVSIKNLYMAPDSTLFKDIMQPALFIPENNSPYQLLEKFKESKIHSAFIVDEYGSILGLITLNDILEAIVGGIPQPNVAEYEIIKRAYGEYVVDAQIPFFDFLMHFEKTDWMDEGDQDYDTLAGFILHRLQRIPQALDKFNWKGFYFEILDMDGQRIDKVLVKANEEVLKEMDENDVH